MLKVVFCFIFLASVRCGQEHLTCLRTDDVLTQQNPQTPQRALQGSPGKRGPRGQMGLRGRQGQKGEPGVLDDRQKTLVHNQLNFLSQEVEALKNQSRDNRELMLEICNKGLFVSPHVYVYQLTPKSQSWQESREVCQNWGGDLAVYGVKTLKDKKKLIQNLQINNIHFWIGVNDIASEGHWIWVNGERANSSELIWLKGQPDGGVEENCVIAHGFLEQSGVGGAWDISCTGSFRGLCEKKY